jgi:PAS domain-containing protein
LIIFRVDSQQYIVALTAFFATSFVVRFLMQRTRRLTAVHPEQAQLLDLTHDSVVVRDMDDVITYWNNGAEALYGWNKHEALGHLAHRLLASDGGGEKPPRRKSQGGSGCGRATG